MTSRTLRMRPATLKRKLKELEQAIERGQHYRWYHTRDMPGSGTKTRLVCEKAALDELHLMSEAEHAEFLEGWYRDDVEVIREQEPLDRIKTQRAAAAINIDHPTYQPEREPAVLSTDMVYITKRGKTYGLEARSVKSSRGGTECKPTRSQLIEQKTWEDEGASYAIVRANGMHVRRSKNLGWIFRAHNETVGRSLSDEELVAQHELLRLFRTRKDMRVINACRSIDRVCDLPAGSGVRAFRQLAGSKKLAFDLNVADPLDICLAEVWRPQRKG